jgi:peptidoglycan/xylan/chitin deacetylase (PgdA/CDA1 family)
MRLKLLFMKIILTIVWGAVAGTGIAIADECGRPNGSGVVKVVEINAAGGPVYGEITAFTKAPPPLKPKEVVLTFDDGPVPWVSDSVLDSLDRYCVKATFFVVGRVAIAYPDMVNNMLARGHTVGGLTWSHPADLNHLRQEQAIDQVERGFAAAALAAGAPIAPFFRFPGHKESSMLLAHLQGRGIAIFSADVVSNDSAITDPRRLVDETLAKIEAHQGGIVQLRDKHGVTAKALPLLLEELNSRGYQIVHLKAREPVTPMESYTAELGPILAKVELANAARDKRRPLPAAGAQVTSGQQPISSPRPTRSAPEATAGVPADRAAQRQTTREHLAIPRGWTASVDTEPAQPEATQLRGMLWDHTTDPEH